MTFREFRYKLYISLTIAGVTLVAGLIFREACMKLPDAKVTFGVDARDFKAATKEAMSLLNHAAGCTWLVEGDDILVLSTDGEPCGKAFHPGITSGHAAMAYACDSRFEIHVEQPGDIHTQTCIVAHEIGHTVGLLDSNRGIMRQGYCPTPIRFTDVERAFLKEKRCYK